MSKKKIDYGGFEDIAELIEDDGRPIRSKSDDLYKEHELLQFLEQEELRLTKLDTFFTRKYDNLVTTPQSQAIHKELSKKVDRKRQDLIKKLGHTQSAVNQELMQMWRSMFDVR